MKSRDKAKGKWQGILSHYGLTEKQLSGDHTACPLCGGEDRFRFDDKDGFGTYFCNACDPGDGFDLVMKIKSMSFKEAAEEIESMLGEIPEYKQPKKKDPKIRLTEAWSKSKPVVKGDIVSTYLQGRKLKSLPSCLRSTTSCYEPDSRKRFGAMLAPVTDKEGNVLNLHRTYLKLGKKAPIDKPKKLMTPIRNTAGSAIRLYKCGKIVGIAEGIETAISCYDQFGIPTWAAISTTMMEAFEPPEGITEIVIFADNDKNFAGQKAAYVLANKMAIRGFGVTVNTPDKPGDWLDSLTRGE